MKKKKDTSNENSESLSLWNPENLKLKRKT